MTTWFRVLHEEEGLWLYFDAEADAGGWAARQVEIRVAGSVPVTAASLAEVIALRDHADLAAMSRHERRYGVLAEASLAGWREWPGATEIPSAEFERLWSAACLLPARS